MNKYEQLKYVEFFNQIIQTTIKIENLKNDIVKSSHPRSLFHYLVKQLSQHKSIYQKQSTLNVQTIKVLLGSQYIKSQLNALIFKIKQNNSENEYRKYNDLSISEQQFLQFLQRKSYLNRKKSESRLKLNKKQAIKFNQGSNKIKQLFKQIIESQKVLDICRQQLEAIPPYYIFDKIDTEKLGYLSKLQIKRFMAQNFVFLSQIQLNALIIYIKQAFQQKLYKQHITFQCFCSILVKSDDKLKNYQLKQELDVCSINYYNNQYLNNKELEDRIQKDVYNKQKERFQQNKKQRRLKVIYQKQKKIQQIQNDFSKQNEKRIRRKRQLQQEYELRNTDFINIDKKNKELLIQQIDMHRSKIKQLESLTLDQYDRNYHLSKNLQKQSKQLRDSQRRAGWCESLVLQQLDTNKQLKQQIKIIQMQQKNREEKLYEQGIKLKKIRERLIQDYYRNDQKSVKKQQRNNNSLYKQQSYRDVYERSERKRELQEQLQRTRIRMQIKRKRRQVQQLVEKEFKQLRQK